ncbi:MAG: nucleotidyltransferase family protein [Armatimonadaceae bacterium]
MSESSSKPVNSQNPVAAILLTAGASRRMGAPKSLLRIEGQPLVSRVARTLLHGGVELLAVVVAPDTVGQQVSQALEGQRQVVTVVNSAPERGMLSSVQAGLQALCALYPELDQQESEQTATNGIAWLVCPVDLPLLNADAVARVIGFWRHLSEPANAIVVPVSSGKRGHPTLFGHFWTATVLAMDPLQEGLNALVRREEVFVTEVPLHDDAVWRDADTPEEWKSLTEL